MRQHLPVSLLFWLAAAGVAAAQTQVPDNAAWFTCQVTIERRNQGDDQVETLTRLETFAVAENYVSAPFVDGFTGENACAAPGWSCETVDWVITATQAGEWASGWRRFDMNTNEYTAHTEYLARYVASLDRTYPASSSTAHGLCQPVANPLLALAGQS